MKKTKSPLVSVVIPTFNEATYVNRLLNGLMLQDFQDFEVIISDAESKDNTKKIAQSFKEFLDLKITSAPPKGPAFGRNIGAKLAKGTWLLFLDADDAIDDPNFMNILVQEAEVRNLQSATAKIRHQDPTKSEVVGSFLNYSYLKFLAKTKHPVSPGWCILTKRELFEKLNGFNEKVQFGEDYDYISRAGKFGFGFIEKTYYYVDLRRNREEGLPFVVKCIANELYRHTHNYNLEKNPLKYEFGKHKIRN